MTFVIFDPLTQPRAFYSRSTARDVGAAHAWCEDVGKATRFMNKTDALDFGERYFPDTRIAVMERDDE